MQTTKVVESITVHKLQLCRYKDYNSTNAAVHYKLNNLIFTVQKGQGSIKYSLFRFKVT